MVGPFSLQRFQPEGNLVECSQHLVFAPAFANLELDF
jgi:hypothetical protein